MFVYNYMAGKVDWLRGGENDEEYDPHDHRKVERPTTYMETMIHVLKGAIGAGLLAMPYAMSRLGLIVGLLSLLFIAAFATYCIQILILAQYQVCKKWRRGFMSFPQTVKLAVESGPKCIRWTAPICAESVDIFLLLWQIGVCVVFTIFVAENVRQLCEFYGHHDTVRMVIIYIFPIQMVMSLIKDLKRLTPFSTAANILVLMGFFLMFFYLIEDDIEFRDDQLQVQSLRDIPVFIGIVLYGLQAPGVVLATEHNMEKPSRFTGICGLFTIAMCIVTGSFILLGVFGFLKYGHNAQSTITLNLPSEQKKAQAVKVAISLSIYLSFPLQNFVAWQIIWRKIGKHFIKRATLADYILRVGLVIFPFMLAVASPQLGPIMGLTGALTISVVAIIIPGLMDLSVHYPDKLGPGNFRVPLNIAIMVVGVIFAVLGVYTSVLEIIETF